MINFEEALNHPLSIGPLILFNADGSARKSGKIRLAQILMSRSNEENADASRGNTMYVVDLMALMRVVTAIPETFEDLAIKLTSILSNQRLSMSWLGCRLLLWKCHQSCREGKERFRNKDNYKITKKLLSNGENKTCMIESLFRAIEEKRSHLLNVLRTPQKIFSHEQECGTLKLIGCSPYSQMLSKHKEANTKFIAVTMKALHLKLLLYI